MHTATSTMTKVMTEFFEDVSFEKEGREYLEPIFLKLCKNRDFVLAESLYEQGKMNKDILMETVIKVSEATGVHNYTVQLLTLILFTKHLKALYKAKNYSMDMYKATVSDLRWKALESFEVKGVWGTFVADWLYGYFELDRFAFGRLQFQLDPLGHDYKHLTSDSICLKIHIPRSGEPLTPESIDAAIAQAKEFFANELTDPVPVICSSYLLYPAFRELYKQGSNLRHFFDRFDIFYSQDDKEGDYPNMWRLFDMDYTGNIDDFPERTSLHRAFKSYLKDGGRTGVALGVFFA